MTVHIGTSGWSYDHWQGVLYPHCILPRERLAYYLPRYRTAELNSSYYRWPSDAAFRAWRRRLPDSFCLSVKAPGSLTHVQRLYQPERWLSRIQHSLYSWGIVKGCCSCSSFPLWHMITRGWDTSLRRYHGSYESPWSVAIRWEMSS
jgi:uncharacterized protein YecE (DUF72 family)